MALVTDVDSGRVRMYHLQTDIVGLDLPRPLPPLFSIHALHFARGLTQAAAATFFCFPFWVVFMLCCPRLLRSRLGPVGETYTISPAGSSPFFKDHAATILTIANHRSHALERAQSATEITALAAEPRRCDSMRS
jgi:hypothetical protein